MLKIGVSKIRITPPLGIIMGGHPGIKRAQGILDDLYARAMAIDNNIEKVVFINADLLFVDNTSVSKIRKIITSKIDIKSNNIFISSTHTHSGPLTTNLFSYSKETDYVNEVEKLIANVALMALNTMHPAEIGFSKTKFPGYSFNSRIIMRGNRVETHPWRWSKDILTFEGPVDDDLLVIVARDINNRIMGILVNYANHPQVMERDNTLLSADFPGWMEKRILERANENPNLYCSDINVMYINGASGNICPVNSCSSENIEVGAEWAKKMGYALADKIINILNSVKFYSDANVRVISNTVSLPIREISQEKIEQAKHFLENPPEVKNVLKLSNYGIEPPNSDCISLEEYLKTDEWKKQEYVEVLALWELKRKCQKDDVELVVVGINDNAIIMAPFELFAEFALDIKEKFLFETIMIGELTNGYAGYLPTKLAFARPGSYETLTLCSSRYIPEAYELVAASVRELLKKI